MGALQERITSTNKGSITSVQAIYVPADDLTDPAPATSFAHLDATTTLSRAISELGIYPAVDPLDSVSRVLTPAVVGQEHYEVARAVQETLQKYKSLQDIIAILGMPSLAGPGSLSVVVTAASQIRGNHPEQYALVYAGVVIGMAVTVLFAFVILRAASSMARVLGPSGIDAMTRIFGFLLVAIGMQFLLTGISDFFNLRHV